MAIYLRTGEARATNKDSRRTAVLERLVNVAEEMLVDRPVSEIALAEILEKAQVARATFYKLFNDLLHFYQYLADRLSEILLHAQLDGYEDIDPEDWRAMVIHMADRGAEFYKTHPVALRLWLAIDRPPSIRAADDVNVQIFLDRFHGRFQDRAWWARLPDPAKGGVDVMTASFRIYDAVLALGFQTAGPHVPQAWFDEAKRASLAYLGSWLE